jgi:hypothetical protein
MRRLTLILSDLYLDADHKGESVPQTHELPALDALLRFAHRPLHIEDWRRWLLPEIAAPGGTDASAGEWLATPVHLEARLDHVRLVDRGLLRIDASERAQWCAAFNQTFGPDCQLEDGNERAFAMTGVPREAVTMRDPARLLGADIGPAVPGANAPQLRRLWAEIEMWLHGAPLNTLRERAGKPRISALWLWGPRMASGQRPGGEPGLALYGGDAFIARAGAPASPRSLADVDVSHDHVVAEFAPLTGAAHESLPSLEANWFAPARQALAERRLDELRLVANDRVFHFTPRDAWRFWRRGVHWLDALVAP